MRTYPVASPSTAPSTGRLLYKHVMQNLKIPAAANHQIWYDGEEAKLQEPDKFAFRGDIPSGKLLNLVSLEGQPIPGQGRKKSVVYELTGEENFVLVKDLSDVEKAALQIPSTARDADKVYNPNFKPYDALPELTRWSNELASLSVPKSISSYLGGMKGKVNYSEGDVLNFIQNCFSDLSGPEMNHILHGNHSAWAALAYMREQGNVEGDIMTEFYGQNEVDFYLKDVGTVLPTLFYTVANVGQDPVSFCYSLDIEVWGAKDAAIYMKKFMPQKEKVS